MFNEGDVVPGTMFQSVVARAIFVILTPDTEDEVRAVVVDPNNVGLLRGTKEQVVKTLNEEVNEFVKVPGNFIELPHDNDDLDPVV